MSERWPGRPAGWTEADEMEQSLFEVVAEMHAGRWWEHQDWCECDDCEEARQNYGAAG